MLKLRIPIRMVGPFLGLSIALQALVATVKNLGYFRAADGLLFLAELLGKGARALASPAQR